MLGGGLMGIVGAAVVVGFAFGVIDGEGGGEAEATPTVAVTPQPSVTAEQVLETYLREALAKEYLGDCGASLMPKEEGKVCSVYKGEKDGRKAFLVGVSSYELTLWLFLEPEGSGWKVYQALLVKPETATVPGAPWPLQVGATVVTAGTGNCLNVRVAPGLKEAAVDCVADGTELVLQEGPVEVDGFQWWRPQGRSGWVAGDWLRYPEPAGGALPTPTATPGPP
jgi:hypothetical protein